MAKVHLEAAKAAKNDEFYTRREDIEKELMHYKEHFRDKVVYCNCDDPTRSEFWQFFVRVFKVLNGNSRLLCFRDDSVSYNENL